MNLRHAALFAFVVATAVVHALVAAWTPIQGDDWNHWIWASQYGDEGITRWFASHFEFSDAIAYVLCRERVVHVLLTPAVYVALVVGLFVVSLRRMPRAVWDDILGIMLVSAMIWITQPNAGVTLFLTSNVALYVYGVTAAVWFIAPLRCGWQVPRAAWPLLVLGGYCVGTSSRAIATGVLVFVVVAIRRTPRERRARWMWLALGSLIVGVIVGYVAPPWLEVSRVFRRGFEANVLGQGLWRFEMQETGELISFVAALALADLALALLGKQRAPVDARPDPGEALRWVLGAFALSVWCLFGPRYQEPTVLPVTCTLVIVALPFVLWFARSRYLCYVIVAFAVGVHVVVWSLALVKYHRFGQEHAARMAALQAAPPGGVAGLDQFSQSTPSFWFSGEDLGGARQRALVSIEVFGLREIELPHSRRLEIDPSIAVTLEVDGASPDQVRAAKPPEIWASDVGAARKQFETFVKRLRKITAKRAAARLVVENVAFPERGSRPLLAAWSDETGHMIPRVARSSLDAHSRHTVRIYPPHARAFATAWIVTDRETTEVEYRAGSIRVQPLDITLHVTIVCNEQRCLVADAFLPRF